MTITPIGNRLLIRPFRGASKRGVIIIPENARKNQFNAIIIAVGDGIKSPALEEGTIIIYDMYNGLIVDPEKNLLLITEEDVISVLAPTEEGELPSNVHIAN